MVPVSTVALREKTKEALSLKVRATVYTPKTKEVLSLKVCANFYTPKTEHWNTAPAFALN